LRRQEPAWRAPVAASWWDDFEAGDDVPRKGRARRFREARKLKQGFDDGLFTEGSGTLADVAEGAEDDEDVDDEDEWDDEDDVDDGYDWDPDRQR
jgi:hypothetical protein